MCKNISKYVWFSFVPFVTLGILTVILFFIKIIPLYYLIFTFIGWVFISGLGISVGYHRLFSHNTHPDLPAWKENIILFFGAISGQGSSIDWVAVHRGYHHKYSDTDKDLHSPIHGIYHSLFGWVAKITENNSPYNIKYAGPILKKKNHRWFYKHHYKILYLVPIIVSLINWKLSLTLLCLPITFSLIQDNVVNFIGHSKMLFNYRNFNTKDNSHNNIILAYLTWGQGWHNNHHHNPKSFDFGKSVSGKWWEIDPCIIFIPFLKNFNK